MVKRRALRALLPLVLLLTLLSSVTRAGAEVERIAFVDGDPTLIGAISTALESWSIEILDVPVPADGINVTNAPRVAGDHAVGAVVWISVTSSHAMIWVFDARANRIVAQRIIAPPPFDEPAAAAVALTLKTLLRHSGVAPEPERYMVARPEGAAPGLPPAGPALIAPATYDARILAAASIGLRWLRTGSSHLEPRLGISLAWTPLGGRFRLGPIAGLHVGPGIAIDELELAGHFNDVVGFVGARGQLPVGPEVALTGALTGVGHATSLTGRIASIGQQVDDRRFNVGLAASAGLEARLGPRLRVGVLAELERQTRRQRYTVFGTPILTLPGFIYSLGLAFTVAM